LLRYKMQPGEEIRYHVAHMAKTKTRIRGTEDLSQVHTVSVKQWRVTEIDAEGLMVFEHRVESVEMSQQAGDAEEVRWDSLSGEAPPVPFESVADRLGKLLVTVRINGRGQVIQREDDSSSKANLGMGDITIPLPEEAISVGEKWSVPREVRVRNREGDVQLIKIRELYTLEKVKTGVATLRVRSEPLTPIRDEEIRSQVVQQMSNGTIRFDLDAGRVIERQLDWDESLVGFQGADSMMEYRARLTEELLPPGRRVAGGKAAAK
jgi:hypothetical protein